MLGKVETFSKKNSICKRSFFIMRILYTKLQSCSLCYRKTKFYTQKIPSVTGIICGKSQNYNIVCNRFNSSFCTKDHKTHLTTISCYIVLHQAAMGEGKNSLRKRRDILVSDFDQERFFIIIIT